MRVEVHILGVVCLLIAVRCLFWRRLRLIERALILGVTLTGWALVRRGLD
jgi:hypothetical protein